MLIVLYHIDMSLFRRAFTTRRYNDVRDEGFSRKELCVLN
jgi:hypothetical protein